MTRYDLIRTVSKGQETDGYTNGVTFDMAMLLRQDAKHSAAVVEQCRLTSADTRLEPLLVAEYVRQHVPKKAIQFSEFALEQAKQAMAKAKDISFAHFGGPFDLVDWEDIAHSWEVAADAPFKAPAKHMVSVTPTLHFAVDVDFPFCDVDAALRVRASQCGAWFAGRPDVVKFAEFTPVSEVVDYLLGAPEEVWRELLADEPSVTYPSDLGVAIKGQNLLMMGCARVNCEMDYSADMNVSLVVSQLTQFFDLLLTKGLVYHKEGDMTGSRVVVNYH